MNTIVFYVSIHICVYFTVVKHISLEFRRAKFTVQYHYIALYDRINYFATAGEPIYTARIIKPPANFNIIQSRIPIINPTFCNSCLIVFNTVSGGVYSTFWMFLNEYFNVFGNRFIP